MITKDFKLWIDSTPTSSPTWVECGIVDMSGDISIRSIPYAEITATVHIPGTLDVARYDARQVTRVRIEAQTPTLGQLPYFYIERAEVVQDDPKVYILKLVSEDGRLLEPSTFATTETSYRTYTTLDTLIPAVLSGTLTLSGSLPVSGVRCDPIYEKKNLILNPNGKQVAAGGQAWAGTNYDQTGAPKFTTLSGNIWFLSHPSDKYPTVSEGDKITYSVAIQVPTGSTLIGKTVRIRMSFYPTYGSQVVKVELYTEHVLKVGVNRYSTTQTVPYRCTMVGVGALVSGTAAGAYLHAYNAILTEADPDDNPVEYWSGVSPATSDYEYEWAGADGNSVSTRYPKIFRSLESVLLDPGASKWSLLEPHLAKQGWRLLPSTPGTWSVVATSSLPFPSGTVTADDGAYLEYRDETDRSASDFADAILLHYTWKSGRGPEREAWDTASTTPFTKVKKIELEQPYPGAGAAAKYLAVAQRAGRPLSVVLPLDLSVVPGRKIETEAGTGMIERQAFNISDDTMTLTVVPVVV